MVINGINLPDIDIADADVAENYEQALTMVKEATQSAHEDLTRSQAIRKCCKGVFAAFDKIFGSGTSQKVFGKQTNMKVCLKAFDELITQVNEIEKANVESIIAISDKYSNRQQRRSNKKKKNRSYVNHKR